MKIHKRVVVGGIPASLTSLATGIGIAKQANMIVGGGSGSTITSWYNLTTGAITCGAIIPCNEVILCL